MHSIDFFKSTTQILAKAEFSEFRAAKLEWSKSNRGELGRLLASGSATVRNIEEYLGKSGYPLYPQIAAENSRISLLNRLPRDLDRANISARRLLSHENSREKVSFNRFADGRGMLETSNDSEFALKAWKLNGKFTVTRNGYCADDNVVVMSNQFHSWLKAEDMLDVVAATPDSLLIVDLPPVDELPEGSLILPNSVNFGHVILGFFPTLVVLLGDLRNELGALVMRKSFFNVQIFREIWECIASNLKLPKLIMHAPVSRPVSVLNPVVPSLSYSHNGISVRVDTYAIACFRQLLGIRNEVMASRGTAILYLRRKDGYRCVKNDDAIATIVESFGGKSICINDMSLKERIAEIGKADVIIGVAGGTLANGVFCSPGRVLIELRPAAYADFPVIAAGHEAPYISEGLGHTLIRVDCEIHRNSDLSPILWDLTVPEVSFRNALSFALDSKG